MIRNNESGFTLIEVMMAVVIFSIGLLGLAMMQAHFASGNADSRQLIRATDIASNQIETLANISDPGDPALNPSTNPHTLTVTNYPLDYDVSWDVTDNGDQTRTIDLTVSWTTGDQNHNVSLTWIKGL